MKKILLPFAVAAFAAATAFGQVSETTTTTTTTTSDGTLTEYTPGTTFVVKETKGPVTYRYGKTVTYVTKSGKVLRDEDIKTRIRTGIPVHVDYTLNGDTRVISRVVVED